MSTVLHDLASFPGPILKLGDNFPPPPTPANFNIKIGSGDEAKSMCPPPCTFYSPVLLIMCLSIFQMCTTILTLYLQYNTHPYYT